MMNDFSFQNTTKVHFGKEALSKLSSEVIKAGHRVLLVYGGSSIKRFGLYDRIISELKKEDIEIFDYDLVKPNPRHTDINIGGRMCRDNQIDAVIFLRDPLKLKKTELDYTRVYDLCDIHNIPLATNVASAEILIMSIDRGDLDWRNAYK